MTSVRSFSSFNRLRHATADLRICRFERRLILRELLLHSVLSKFTSTSPFLTLAPFGRKLHDLQIARTVGRGDDNRAERLDLAF